MWNRFWMLISTLWAWFCLVGYGSGPAYEPGWLLLGSAGFVLWVMGYWVKNGFRKRG